MRVAVLNLIQMRAYKSKEGLVLEIQVSSPHTILIWSTDCKPTVIITFVFMYMSAHFANIL